MKSNISATMKQIYGTGNFNPRRFDRRPNRNRGRVYLWGISIFLFAIIAVVLGGLYLFARTPDSFIGDKVYFELSGSLNPKIAQIENYTLKIINNEEVDLEDIELFIDWSSASNDSASAVAHFISSEIAPESEANNTWKLGSLGVGQMIDFNFQVRFVGLSKEKFTLPFKFSVKPNGFGSAFELEHFEQFELGDPTINLAINGPEVATNGASIGFDILITGDSLGFGDISKLKLSIVAPDSFSLTSSLPELKDSNQLEWILAELPRQGDAYKAYISGDLTSKAGEENIFSAELVRDNEKKPIATSKKTVSIQSADAKVSIAVSPFQGKKLQWNERADYVITINNTSEYVMRDVVVSANAPDDALWQESSLNLGNNGFFESGQFIWDSSTTAALESIRPKASVSLKFSLTAISAPPKGFIGSPTLSVIALVSSSLGEQDFSVQSQKADINILSDVDFDINAWYTNPEGVTVGSGPRSPQAGQESVYEISFKLGPTTSDLKDIELLFDLSNLVSLKDESNYSVGELSFDEENSQIVWSASRVPALEIPIEIRFKIGVMPVSSLSQAAVLLDNIKLIVVDANANESMEFFGRNITVGDIE